MYLIHKQGGYFTTIAKVVESVLDKPCTYSSNPQDKGIWILFFTSFISGFYKKITSPYIVIQTEPIERTFNRFPEYKEMCESAIDVLDFSKNLSIGYSDVFRLECENSKDIDVLFYGVLSERRKKILDQIDVPNKVIFHTSPPIYGEELWKFINRSKIVLSISCYDDRIEPDWFRIAPLLSNKVFVLCENVKEENFNQLKNHIPICDYESIPNLIKHFLKNPLNRIKWADKGFDFIRNNHSKIILKKHEN
jgi:hypothetical protein